MTSEVIPQPIQHLCLHNVSIHINSRENQFINECARKKKLNSLNYIITICFMICRRTYILNNTYFTLYNIQYKLF